jgi:hypothetical protein
LFKGKLKLLSFQNLTKGASLLIFSALSCASLFAGGNVIGSTYTFVTAGVPVSLSSILGSVTAVEFISVTLGDGMASKVAVGTSATMACPSNSDNVQNHVIKILYPTAASGPVNQTIVTDYWSLEDWIYHADGVDISSYYLCSSVASSQVYVKALVTGRAATKTLRVFQNFLVPATGGVLGVGAHKVEVNIIPGASTKVYVYSGSTATAFADVYPMFGSPLTTLKPDTFLDNVPTLADAYTNGFNFTFAPFDYFFATSYQYQ